MLAGLAGGVESDGERDGGPEGVGGRHKTDTQGVFRERKVAECCAGVEQVPVGAGKMDGGDDRPQGACFEGR